MQVTIIGGGSYQWGPELIADLLSTPALAGCRLVLEDIDPAPLQVMGPLAEKVNEAMGARATMSTTTDQRRALDGADFVMVTISTGGFASMDDRPRGSRPLRHPPAASPTPWDRWGSPGPCATSRSSWASGGTWRSCARTPGC